MLRQEMTLALSLIHLQVEEQNVDEYARSQF
jgi:hypothetical protein